MGYTTTFEGRFHCYRPESKELGVFLQAIREGDRVALAALGDWLLEHDDPRGEVVAGLSRGPEGNLAELWRLFGLMPEHVAYLTAFSQTRRMRRDPAKAQQQPDPIRDAAGLPIGPEAAYFVGRGSWMVLEHNESILDYNLPPKGQPGLWCKWVPDKDGTALVWNGVEKFYDYVDWLEYLLQHFLGPWGYLVNGEMTCQGEKEIDRGRILVTDNRVQAVPEYV